jgi:energy-coupling factor transport system ATP-binding protein
VLTTHPRAIVLDEPTSALDPGAAEEVLAALQRLVHDLGMTVVLAEHRLERVVQYADRVVVLEADSAPESGTPAAMMALSPVVPPVVQLGRLAGWSPLPVSVRDARRLARPLRARLATSEATPARLTTASGGPVVLACDDLAVSYGPVPALDGVSLTVGAGTVMALMGRNGAGKSTLLKAAVGLLRPRRGSVTVTGADPLRLTGSELLRRVGFVPQEPADLLCEDSVRAECRAADADADLPAGRTASVLATLAPDIDPDSHPGDLSEGQRLSLVLAVVLSAEPPVLLLDEPTRGLDYGSKGRLVTILRDLAARGTAVVIATHDVELVADVADRVAIVADGQIVADGPTRDIVTASPIFAPQVAKIMAPDSWLTVDSVAHAMAVAG